MTPLWTPLGPACPGHLTGLRGELHFTLPGGSILGVLGWGIQGGLQVAPGGGWGPRPPFAAAARLLHRVLGRVPIDQIPQKHVDHPQARHLGQKP